MTLGLCTQIELDEVIAKSADKRRKLEAEKAEKFEGPGLAPAQDDASAYDDTGASETSDAGDISADDIFKNFS